ncbi:hypothetical protein B0T16DRAFT_507025 [Cercophora newfieldiana]|uniref:Uncharacterized protein n=1 Tax=Cercophora newfieldiana TaxID=92897 RepID=A0AA39YCT8_9PEZI|nr:hypothetical protein B0T16DRAFT_507025 [Cercophora newfieldiana]
MSGSSGPNTSESIAARFIADLSALPDEDRPQFLRRYFVAGRPGEVLFLTPRGGPSSTAQQDVEATLPRRVLEARLSVIENTGNDQFLDEARRIFHTENIFAVSRKWRAHQGTTITAHLHTIGPEYARLLRKLVIGVPEFAPPNRGSFARPQQQFTLDGQLCLLEIKENCRGLSLLMIEIHYDVEKSMGRERDKISHKISFRKRMWKLSEGLRSTPNAIRPEIVRLLIDFDDLDLGPRARNAAKREVRQFASVYGWTVGPTSAEGLYGEEAFEEESATEEGSSCDDLDEPSSEEELNEPHNTPDA